MKKTVLLSMLIVTSILNAQERPKLVVGIVVDQMKMEYLYRYSDDLSSDGFKRLMNNGYTFHNMHFNYMPTYTGPGHTSIYTGTTPSIHGIVGNDWFNRSTGKELYCTDDASVHLLGDGKPDEGEMSPKNLQATTITDELRQEGIAREFVNRVQNYRKDSGFEVTDKIKIELLDTQAEVSAGVLALREYISQEVQAVSLEVVNTFDVARKREARAASQVYYKH